MFSSTLTLNNVITSQTTVFITSQTTVFITSQTTVFITSQTTVFITSQTTVFITSQTTVLINACLVIDQRRVQRRGQGTQKQLPKPQKQRYGLSNTLSDYWQKIPVRRRRRARWATRCILKKTVTFLSRWLSRLFSGHYHNLPMQ